MLRHALSNIAIINPEAPFVPAGPRSAMPVTADPEPANPKRADLTPADLAGRAPVGAARSSGSFTLQVERAIMAVVVVAKIVPKSEHRDELIAAIRAAIEQVHTEDGCELYALHEAPDHLIIVEKWASGEALATHEKSPALAALNPKLAGKVAGRPEVIVLRPVPAGEPGKGEL
jgi:quinol monooxygenase YgiN